MKLLVAIVAIAASAASASADPEQEFRAAGELAAKRDPRAVDAYEALGGARPISIWTDDAWIEAARVSELAADYDRARKDLAEAIAISDDAQLVRRAKRDLERLEQMTGGGEWTAVAAEHQRLITAIARGGDPTPSLEALEQVAKANVTYPRGVGVRIAIARGWEEEDDVDRALGWLRDAVRIGAQLDAGRGGAGGSSAGSPRATEQARARIELIRMLTRNRELAEARRELTLLSDQATRRSLERKLGAAESQRVVRWIVAAMLFVMLASAIVLLRRRSGSWRAVAKRLARPPAEVLFFVPIAVVVGFVATTGNPLVAKAVIWILIGAAAIAWISGVTLDAARPISRRHAIVHALVVGIAVLASVFLAIDHARLVDLVTETWRTGPGN